MMKDKHKPHLLMLLTQDLHSPSGLGRYFPLAKYLVREGAQVTILALNSDFANLDQRDFVTEGVDVRYVAQMHVRKSGNMTYYFSPTQLAIISIKAIIVLFREGMKENADLIFVGKPHPMNGLAGLRLARRKGLPLIIDCDDYEAESNRVTSHFQKTVLKLFEKRIPRAADMVTTNTYFMRDQLVNWGVGKEKIVYVPNGVDTERFSDVSLRRLTQLRTELGLDGKSVIGYYGSLNLKSHPVDLLLKSFKIIAEVVPETMLLMVGGGKDLEFVETLAADLGLKDRIVFTGRINPEDMNMYYRLADVSVDPARDTMADRGRCPLKLFESWHMGIPVITSDVGDRKILAGNPSAILLAKPGDEEDLARKIYQVLSDINLIGTLRTAGFENVNKYNWAAIANLVYKRIELLGSRENKERINYPSRS